MQILIISYYTLLYMQASAAVVSSYAGTLWSHCAQAQSEAQRRDPRICPETMRFYDGPSNEAPLLAVLDGCPPPAVVVPKPGDPPPPPPPYARRAKYAAIGRDGKVVGCNSHVFVINHIFKVCYANGYTKY